MKNKLPLSAFFIVLLLSGCNEEEYRVPNDKSDKGFIYHVDVIDSCEYISAGTGYGWAFTHKGNCKFCKNRQSR